MLYRFPNEVLPEHKRTRKDFKKLVEQFKTLINKNISHHNLKYLKLKNQLYQFLDEVYKQKLENFLNIVQICEIFELSVRSNDLDLVDKLISLKFHSRFGRRSPILTQAINLDSCDMFQKLMGLNEFQYGITCNPIQYINQILEKESLDKFKILLNYESIKTHFLKPNESNIFIQRLIRLGCYQYFDYVMSLKEFEVPISDKTLSFAKDHEDPYFYDTLLKSNSIRHKAEEKGNSWLFYDDVKAAFIKDRKKPPSMFAKP